MLYDAHMRVGEGPGLGTSGDRAGAASAPPRRWSSAGGWLVSQGTVTIGTVTFFVLTLSNLFRSPRQLSQLFTVQSAGAGPRRCQVLDERSRRPSGPGVVDLPERGDLVVDASRSPTATTRRYCARFRVDLIHRRRGGWRSWARRGGESPPRQAIAPYHDPVERVRSPSAGGPARRHRLVIAAAHRGRPPGPQAPSRQRAAGSDGPLTPTSRRRSRRSASRPFRPSPDGLTPRSAKHGRACRRGEAAGLVGPGRPWPTRRSWSSTRPRPPRPGHRGLVEGPWTVSWAAAVIVIAHRLTTAERADRVGVVDAGPPSSAPTTTSSRRGLRRALRHLVAGVPTWRAPDRADVAGVKADGVGGHRRRTGSPGRRRSRARAPRAARRADAPAMTSRLRLWARLMMAAAMAESSGSGAEAVDEGAVDLQVSTGSAGGSAATRALPEVVDGERHAHPLRASRGGDGGVDVAHQHRLQAPRGRARRDTPSCSTISVNSRQVGLRELAQREVHGDAGAMGLAAAPFRRRRRRQTR